MMRHCDGNDPNLLDDDMQTPCAHGCRFDDVEHSVIYPHQSIRTADWIKTLLPKGDIL